MPKCALPDFQSEYFDVFWGKSLAMHCDGSKLAVLSFFLFQDWEIAVCGRVKTCHPKPKPQKARMDSFCGAENLSLEAAIWMSHSVYGAVRRKKQLRKSAMKAWTSSWAPPVLGVKEVETREGRCLWA